MKRICYTISIYVFLTACGQSENGFHCDIFNDDKYFEVAERNGYQAYYDLDKARYCSKVSNKPILLVFSCWACTSMPEIEWEIFTDNDVRKIVEENYILTVLYTDDKRQLESFDTTKLYLHGKVIKTVGQKNKSYQIEHFGNMGQPFYAVVGHDMNKLAEPLGYIRLKDKTTFISFLRQGVGAQKADKFDSGKWIQGNKRTRGIMTKDLVYGHLLMGKTRQDVSLLLGNPEDSALYSYYYTVDFGYKMVNIDWYYRLAVDFDTLSNNVVRLITMINKKVR